MTALAGSLLVGLALATGLEVLASRPEALERQAFDAFFDAPRAAPLQRSPAARALEAEGHVAHREPHSGVPSFYWAMRAGERAPEWAGKGLTATEAARRYLYLYAPLWGFSPPELAAARFDGDFALGRGAQVVRFSRELDGVPVFRDRLSLVLTGAQELVAIAGWLLPHAAPQAGFLLAPETALAFAALDVRLPAPLAADLRSSGEPARGWTRFADGSGHLASARARKVWFTLPERLEPAWHVEVEGQDRDGRPQAWGLALSATDGRVLWRKNLTELAQATFRVWADAAAPFAPLDGPQGTFATPHPTGLFDGAQPPLLPPALVSLDHGPNPRNDSWLLAGATSLSANAAVAYADVWPPQGFVPDAGTPDGGDASGLLAMDVAPVASAPLIFDDLYDTARSPRASAGQARAAATQAFFTVSWVHDWLYALGFDEAKGNAQADNFGRGGLGGDATLVEALDWQFPEGAAMTSPADGQAPRLQLGNAEGKGPSFLTPDVPDGGRAPAGQSNLGPQVFDVSGPLVLLADGVDAGYDGCEALLSPAALQGAIALSVGSGRCAFRAVVDRAADAGAVGVVIGTAQLTSGNQPYIGDDPTGVTLPVLSISGLDTRPLLQVLLDGGTLPQARMERPFVPERPAALDATIVTHEYGHLVSNRLVGDSAGLTLKISRAVAEGWSDFLALLATVRETDAAAAANPGFGGLYAIGGYFAGGTRLDGTGNASHYLGVRRYPYSTNFLKNGLMFRHIADSAPLPLVPGSPFRANSEVHNTGEVLAVMLWEGLVGMLRKGSLTFPEATRRMGLYLLGSMQASPLNPDLLEARDALLAVAWAADPADFVTLFDAFARRGAGPAAVAPPKTALNNTPVTEDTAAQQSFLFIEPPLLSDEPDWCDRDGTLDSSESGSLTVVLRNRGSNDLNAVTGKVSSASAGVTIADGGTFSIPKVLPYQTAQAKVPVALAGALDVRLVAFSVTAAAPGVGNPNVSRTFELRANADVIAGAREDFEAELDWRSGWSRGGEIYPFIGFEGFFQQRRSTPIDSQLFVPNPREWADLWAVTPAMKASATAPLVVTFDQRWSFEVDSGGRTYDGAFLEVSTDGTNWTRLSAELSVPYSGTIDPISRNPFAGQAAWVDRSPAYPTWVTTTVNLGTAYAGQNVYLRFHFGSDPGSPAPGWEIDDLRATGLDNQPFKQVVPDRGSCVQRQPKVDAGPDREVEERAEVKLAATATDPDGDALTITWRQVGGPPVALDVDTFVAPEVTQATPLEFEVSASDGRFSRLDRVVLTVTDVNRAPVVTLEAVPDARAGDTVTLTASATDPDGDPITFAWTQDEGTKVALESADTTTATFRAPAFEKKTALVFSVAVSDGRDTGRGQVTVQVLPAGCGCSSGSAGAGAGLGALLWALARRRRR